MTVTISPRILAQNTIRNVEAFGGSTESYLPGVITPTSGYVVSLPGHEVVRESVSDPGFLEFVQSYIESKTNELAQPGRYLGAWTDNGALYLDVSEVHSELATAVKLGWQRNQLAIYDIAKEREIRTRPGRRTYVFDEQTTADRIAHETGLVSAWFNGLGSTHGQIMASVTGPSDPSPFETIAAGVYDAEKDTLTISELGDDGELRTVS